MRAILNEYFTRLDPKPIRVWSLVMTIYGDCVLPRGGELWLGTLTDLLVAMGVEAGTVRAAVSRLARDGLLQRRRVGRTSHYALTDRARAMTLAAAQRIYRDHAPQRPQGWDLAVALEGRPNLSQTEAAGYAALVPGLFARPTRPGSPAPDGLLSLHASADPQNDARLGTALYPLAAIASAYETFRRAAPLLLKEPLAEDEAILKRIALVHGFRRVALRDPHLWPDALPQDWPADAAYAMFADAYRALRPASDAWLDANARNADGPLPRSICDGLSLDRL